MKPIDSLSQFNDGARIVENIVGGSQPGVTACLRGENGANLFGCAAIASGQALSLHGFVNVDYQDAIDAVSLMAALDEQGDHQDDIGTDGGSKLELHMVANQRVQNGIQIGPC